MNSNANGRRIEGTGNPIHRAIPALTAILCRICRLLPDAFIPIAHASLLTQGPWPALMSARNLVRGPNGETCG